MSDHRIEARDAQLDLLRSEVQRLRGRRDEWMQRAEAAEAEVARVRAQVAEEIAAAIDLRLDRTKDRSGLPRSVSAEAFRRGLKEGAAMAREHAQVTP